MTTTATVFAIRLRSDAPGVPPQDREPVVGRWYFGIKVDYDMDNKPRDERHGELMRYDGDGCWTNEGEDLEGLEPDPLAYDYLQEQVGA